MIDFIHPQLNDQFAYSLFGENGFFVEAGAGNIGDGTLILEKYFSWNGILIEPIDNFLRELKRRRNCIIEHALLWSEIGLEKTFLVFEDGCSSTVEDAIPAWKSNLHNTKSETYIKKTNTLDNIFNKYGIDNIDYMCLDAEGSEYYILSGLDLNKVRPKLISTEDRKSHELLLNNGYTEVYNPYKPEKYKFEFYYIDSNLKSLLDNSR